MPEVDSLEFKSLQQSAKELEAFISPRFREMENRVKVFQSIICDLKTSVLNQSLVEALRVVIVKPEVAHYVHSHILKQTDSKEGNDPELAIELIKAIVANDKVKIHGRLACIHENQEQRDLVQECLEDILEAIQRDMYDSCLIHYRQVVIAKTSELRLTFNDIERLNEEYFKETFQWLSELLKHKTAEQEYQPNSPIPISREQLSKSVKAITVFRATKDLRLKYAELFNEPTNANNRDWLVIHRHLRTFQRPQNLAPSAATTLPVPISTLQQCHHDNPVNNHGEQGEA